MATATETSADGLPPAAPVAPPAAPAAPPAAPAAPAAALTEPAAPSVAPEPASPAPSIKAAAAASLPPPPPKSKIQVAVRVRPESAAELMDPRHRNIIDVQEKVIFISPSSSSSRQSTLHLPGPKHRKPLQYVFDRVYDAETAQTDVYQTSVAPLLSPLLDGYNSSVFCYGATGAGKTFTMMGDEAGTTPGIMPLALGDLFRTTEKLKAGGEWQVEIDLSYCEVYNETIRDLLAEGRTKLALREGDNGVADVAGLTWLRGVADAAAVLAAVEKGNARRVRAETGANEASSRSHAILQVRLRTRTTTAGTSTTWQCGKLSLIDLAGSERAAATQNRGIRMKEGANINKSLLALGNVITQLQKGRRFVGWRDSKLTRMLKDSLGGNCRTLMIANISPSGLTYEDTHNALKYANRAREITVDPRRNLATVSAHVTEYKRIIASNQLTIGELQAQVRDLRRKLEQGGRDGTVCESCGLAKTAEASEEGMRKELRALAERQAALQRTVLSAERSKEEVRYNLRIKQSNLLIRQLGGAPGEQQPVGIVGAGLLAQEEEAAAESAMQRCSEQEAEAKKGLRELSDEHEQLRQRLSLLPPKVQARIEAESKVFSVRINKLDKDRQVCYFSARERHHTLRWQELSIACDAALAAADAGARALQVGAASAADHLAPELRGAAEAVRLRMAQAQKLRQLSSTADGAPVRQQSDQQEPPAPAQPPQQQQGEDGCDSRDGAAAAAAAVLAAPLPVMLPPPPPAPLTPVGAPTPEGSQPGQAVAPIGPPPALQGVGGGEPVTPTPAAEAAQPGADAECSPPPRPPPLTPPPSLASARPRMGVGINALHPPKRFNWRPSLARDEPAVPPPSRRRAPKPDGALPSYMQATASSDQRRRAERTAPVVPPASAAWVTSVAPIAAFSAGSDRRRTIQARQGPSLGLRRPGDAASVLSQIAPNSPKDRPGAAKRQRSSSMSPLRSTRARCNPPAATPGVDRGRRLEEARLQRRLAQAKGDAHKQQAERLKELERSRRAFRVEGAAAELPHGAHGVKRPRDGNQGAPAKRTRGSGSSGEGAPPAQGAAPEPAQAQAEA